MSGGVTRVTFEEELDKHGQFVFTGEGDSMRPMLRGKRDLIVVRKRPVDEAGRPLRLKKYDIVFYRRGSSCVVHRILRVLPTGKTRPRRWTRQGLKPIAGDYVIAGDYNCFREYDIREEQILGVVTAFVRDGKEISVDDPGYRIYARLWCACFPVRAAVLRVYRKLKGI